MSINALKPLRKPTRFLTPLVLLILSLISAPGGGAAIPANRAHVTILATTDLHGHILPEDYYTNRPAAVGLAKAATIIKEARKTNPDLLLLDSGDTIQGTPLLYYHNTRDDGPVDPMMLAMNTLHYDAMTVGNHEYNFGLKVLEKARREASFPFLSANTYDAGTDRTHYTPYIIKEVEGVRVGILGLTTPGIPAWENKENYAGLEFHETVAEARKWVRVLHEKEHADLVVVAMHMGLEEDLATGEISPGQVENENAAVRIATDVPGIDVILMGHTHREVPSVYINGVLLTQADKWADRVARVDVYLEKSGGHWRITAKGARTFATTDQVAPDPEIARLVEPYERETQSWLGRVIGVSQKELSASGAQFADSAILDLVQRVQLDAGHADVSMVAVFNPGARIPKGDVTVRDIAGIYTYENTLVVLEVTGQQLKDALEHSALYFRPFLTGKRPVDLVDDKIPGYNFDSAEGVEYDLDITKPVGQRILNLRFQGKPLDPRQKLRLATNNYRVNGGGGYTMYKNAPVVYRSSEEIRDLIINWVERHHEVPTEPDNNWRLLTADR